MKMENALRDPTSYEAAVLRRLLSPNFAGREELSEQLRDCKVRIIDDEGSLAIQPTPNAPAARVEHGIPVEAEASDEDGVHVHFLLFVRNGFADELEIYKEDGSVVKRLPSPDELKLMVIP